VGLTLRFPRVRRIRYDKEISGVMTGAQLMAAQSRVRTMRPAGGGAKEDDAGGRKKRGRGAVDAGEPSRKRISAPSGASYVVNVTEDSKLAKETDLFEGKVFCVLENTFSIPDYLCKEITPRSFSASEFAVLIYRFGGKVVANPIDDSLVICGNKRTIPIQNIIKSKKCDVLDFTYIFECIEANSLLSPKTRHFVGMSSKCADELASRCDLFGDSFTEEVSDRDVLQLFRDMDFAIASFRGGNTKASSKPSGGAQMQTPIAMSGLMQNSNYKETVSYYNNLMEQGNGQWMRLVGGIECDEDREALHAEMIEGSRRCLFSRNKVVAYIAGHADCEVGSKLWLAGERLRLHGAELSRELSVHVTHVVAGDMEEDDRRHLKDQVRHLRYDPTFKFEKRIVSTKWVDDCLESGNLIIPPPDV
jgi:hypothetical protein